jgi:hypothetical protein
VVRSDSRPVRPLTAEPGDMLGGELRERHSPIATGRVVDSQLDSREASAGRHLALHAGRLAHRHPPPVRRRADLVCRRHRRDLAASRRVRRRPVIPDGTMR